MIEEPGGKSPSESWVKWEQLPKVALLLIYSAKGQKEIVMIDIKGMDKVEVFRKLYNKARTQGMGQFQWQPGDVDYEKAKQLFESHSPNYYFDYVLGRVMKVNLKNDEFDPCLYDRDNGQGAAYSALFE